MAHRTDDWTTLDNMCDDVQHYYINSDIKELKTLYYEQEQIIEKHIQQIAALQDKITVLAGLIDTCIETSSSSSPEHLISSPQNNVSNI
jgi:hypothetical protein